MAFRICLVGCGYMSENGHGPMLAQYARMRPAVELAACCDISAERAAGFAASFGFGAWYTDMDDMIRSARPDGIVLSVPARLTAKMAVQAVSLGIPVLAEKPPGVTVAEGKTIAAAAAASGAPVSVAFNRRSMPLVEALVREIDGLNSEIMSVSVEMRRTGRTEPDFSMTLIHSIDLARYLCRSDYAELRFLYREYAAAAPAADILALGRMQSGTAVSLACHPMSGVISERVTIGFEEHSLMAELPVYGSVDGPGRIVHYKQGRIIRETMGEPYDHPAEANGFLGQLVSFFDAVREGGKPCHGVGETLQSLEIACCVSRRSALYQKHDEDGI